ncbi:DEAD/DEAH box helicase [Corynebacterium kroppenstedtii]|uniref:ATP-dependent RNA helicase DeaD n=1 Tax=Corynebacterium kroppenstedtii TaxID=161879 RepID=A0A2W5UJG8_9CORY|nr:DEAD/DEAH box helicase [Corynebacterium kroppenstedtii]MDU7287352.1 DEAD/DEAH box helicase [Corynebacterium kroppenstedtii]PZR03414.1 MAG: ATP-dependent RNA helicase [Corynebacterium kroppenstedtii]
MADEPTTPTDFETDSVKGGESASSAMGNESDGPTQGTDMSVNENVDEQRGADDDALTLDDVISADSVDDSKDKSEPTTSSDVADSADEAHTASSDDSGDETRAEDTPEQESTSDQDASDEDDEDNGPSFDDLDLSDDVVLAVKKVGFETPSPIQAATIPILAQGRDVVGLAQTGTGKTAAFALPILSRLDRSQKKPQALVLSPTRELALQVADAFQEFADHLGGVHVLPIYGGQSYGIQLSGLRRGAHIVVGTPGRVIDHLERGSLDLSELKYLVLDEADEMLNMGFQEDVERILADTPEHKQTALFSATMPASIRRLSKQYLEDPREVTIKSQQRTADNIHQQYLLVNHHYKLDALTRILEVTEFDAMIMFARTKQNTEELAEKLRARGFSAAAINGDMAQNQRERTVDQLRDGRLDILVATDVAARGLDVERISHVVNYDIPHDTESYVHRIGRTGRAGRSGEAILFVTPRERRLLRSIERATKSSIEEMQLPTVDEVNETRKAKFAQSITESLADPQVDLFRSLINSYAEEHETPLADIAAALATQSQSGDEFLLKEDTLRRNDRRNDRRGRRNDREPDTRSLNERFSGKEPPRFTDRTGKEMAVYKIAVGKRQQVRPGAIVGAIANEGGLNSRDFGKISIFSEHSLVELPADLPMEVFEALEDTRVSGQLIKIEPDPGAPAGRPGAHKWDRQSGDRRGGRFNDRGHGDRRSRGRDGGRGFNDRGFRGRGRDDRSRDDRGRGGRDSWDRGDRRCDGGRNDRNRGGRDWNGRGGRGFNDRGFRGRGRDDRY